MSLISTTTVEKNILNEGSKRQVPTSLYTYDQGIGVQKVIFNQAWLQRNFSHYGKGQYILNY